MGLTIVENETGDATGDRSLRKHVASGLKTVYLKITFDNSYPTGGETLGLATYGLTPASVSFVGFEPTSNRIATYDRTNDKVLLYTALGTEAANASDQSTIVVYAKFVGSVPQ